MVLEITAMAVGGLLTGVLLGVAFSQHRYMTGYHAGYHEALEYVDSQTILTVDESGNPVPLESDDVESLERK